MVALLIGLAVVLSACAPAKESWIGITQDHAELCRLAGEHIAKNNKLLLEARREGVSKMGLGDPELMPRGRIYERMAGSLSDRDLIFEINNKFSAAYTYEYAERLYRRGASEDSLRFAYAGVISSSPAAFKTDGRNLSYRNEYLKESGGFPPSECLVYTICNDQKIEAPSYLSDCEKMRK